MEVSGGSRLAEQLRVYEALADCLAGRGPAAVFTYLSDDVAGLVAELKRRGVRVLTTRHEHAAVGMADGFARFSGEVGVALVGRGPGLTNSLNALITAHKARSRVLVLAGEEPSGWSDPAVRTAVAKRPVGKYVDQDGLLTALGVLHRGLDDPSTALGALLHSLERARSGSTVVLGMPIDVLEAQAATARPPAAGTAAPAREPAPADIRLIADLLETGWAAKHPVVLAGRGAIEAGATAELRRLADMTRAVLATSLPARNLFAGHPLDAGVAGTFSSPVGLGLLARSDVLLAFGASLNAFTTLDGRLFEKAKVVQVDCDRRAIGQHLPVDIGVVADAGAAARALNRELESRGWRAATVTDQGVAASLSAYRLQDSFHDSGSPGALDVRTVMLELDRILPSSRAVVFDGGNQALTSIRYLVRSDPGAFAWTNEYYAIGCGLGVALGATVARPDRTTVFVTGDGALMMSLADLDTAARLRLPLVIVVADDGALGTEAHYLRDRSLPSTAATYRNPDLARLGEAAGLEAVTLAQMADLEHVEERVASLRRPLLVHCKVNGEIVPEIADSRPGAAT
jgi:thiamine pyrophosphate-dependent acetolactate synthase large subunit-like protein